MVHQLGHVHSRDDSWPSARKFAAGAMPTNTKAPKTRAFYSDTNAPRLPTPRYLCTLSLYTSYAATSYVITPACAALLSKYSVYLCTPALCIISALISSLAAAHDPCALSAKQ